MACRDNVAAPVSITQCQRQLGTDLPRGAGDEDFLHRSRNVHAKSGAALAADQVTSIGIAVRLCADNNNAE